MTNAALLAVERSELGLAIRIVLSAPRAFILLFCIRNNESIFTFLWTTFLVKISLLRKLGWTASFLPDPPKCAAEHISALGNNFLDSPNFSSHPVLSPNGFSNPRAHLPIWRCLLTNSGGIRPSTFSLSLAASSFTFPFHWLQMHCNNWQHHY